MGRRGRPKKLTTLDGVVVPTEPSPPPLPRTPPASFMDQPLTPREAARWLRVSPITLKRRLAEGMPAVNVGDDHKKAYRFIPRDVIDFLKKRNGG